ncbi:hypothetical protein EDB92DRAFT_986724 [Lactarius akahatsu]|uniref:Uncharacterized protein n=1 Tax=Lactarius akahatsu TaxID=416441 RepID=A0AAD4Q9J8_9AGAM|nr:hypothetical protein EDB92DRAFT_986724 [Lactarius akahatsu]
MPFCSQRDDAMLGSFKWPPRIRVAGRSGTSSSKRICVSFPLSLAGRTIRGLEVDDLLRIDNTWGPDTRSCVWFQQQPIAELRHKLCVDVAVKLFIRKFPSSHGELDHLQAFSVLFSVLPQDFSRAGRPIAAAEVASEHINDLILNATIEAETAEQIRFFGSLRTHPWFKPATTRILKAFALTWLSAHPASKPISCTAAAASAPALKIPVCPKVRAIPFTSLTLLGDVKKHAFPFCFLPVSQTLPTVDAIIFDKKLLITIQVTVSPRQSVDSSALEKIWDGLPLAIRRKHRWCHVFVTGDGRTAVELRRQPRENPPGIDICYYSAIFDVEQLGLIRGHLNDTDLLAPSERLLAKSAERRSGKVRSYQNCEIVSKPSKTR